MCSCKITFLGSRGFGREALASREKCQSPPPIRIPVGFARERLYPVVFLKSGDN
jgi:hypothetical protein